MESQYISRLDKLWFHAILQTSKEIEMKNFIDDVALLFLCMVFAYFVVEVIDWRSLISIISI